MKSKTEVLRLSLISVVLHLGLVMHTILHMHSHTHTQTHMGARTKGNTLTFRDIIMAQNFYIVVVLILCNKSFIFLLIVIVKVSVYFQRLPKKGERREKNRNIPAIFSLVSAVVCF